MPREKIRQQMKKKKVLTQKINITIIKTNMINLIHVYVTIISVIP